MTEPRRRFDIDHKTGIPTLQQWAAHKRQAALYAEGIFQGYRAVSPMPAGSHCPCGSCADVGCDVCPCHGNRRQLPPGDYIVGSLTDVGQQLMSQVLHQAEQRFMKHYALRDAMNRWKLYGGSSPYPNKLRAKDDQVRSAAELLHWDTVMSMASPPLRVTVVPDFGCDCRFRCR